MDGFGKKIDGKWVVLKMRNLLLWLSFITRVTNKNNTKKIFKSRTKKMYRVHFGNYKTNKEIDEFTVMKSPLFKL